MTSNRANDEGSDVKAEPECEVQRNIPELATEVIITVLFDARLLGLRSFRCCRLFHMMVMVVMWIKVVDNIGSRIV